MKKLIILAAFGAAGLVSANINTQSSLNTNNKETIAIESTNNTSTTKVTVDNCFAITYVLSCGERIYDSYCDSYDPIECDPFLIWEAWDNELC